jgi:TetR/AcrR family transcriptional repressor of nem operon
MDTRDRLIETARTLFLQNGYGNTGIAQILKVANVGSGSLYYYFPTKEDLLLAVLQKYKEMLWPFVIQPVFERVSDPVERIFGVLDGYRQMLVLTEFENGCPIGNLALELSNNVPSARELLAENFTGWREAIEQCASEAADRLPEGVSASGLALFVLTTMEGAVMLARTYRSMEPYNTAVTQLRDYFERLLHDGTEWTKSRQAFS